MKYKFLSIAVVISIFLLTACSKDSENTANGNLDNGLLTREGILEIGISNTGVTTRATRPVGSSAAANQVNKVQLKAYKKDTDGTWTAASGITIKDQADLLLDWTATTTETVPGHNDSKTVTITGLAAAATYKFVTYGYHTTTTKTYAETATPGIFTSDTQTSYDIEEVFAGESDEIVTDASGKFATKTVTLVRQVAGLLAYFKSVPAYINDLKVEKIVVSANKQAEQYTFPSKTDFNGSGMATGITSDELLTFTMATIATNYNTAGKADAYTFAPLTGATDGNKTASQTCPVADDYTAPIGLALEENSMFGGRYIMPYDQHYDEQTLSVIFYNGTNVLRTLKIVTNEIPSGGTKYNYDIRRNNFYSIGKKLYTGNIGGDPDPDPTPGTPDDPDTPVDLNKSTDIVVIVNDAWEVLHDMGVE